MPGTSTIETASRSFRIALVEDDLHLATVVSTMLTAKGYQVVPFKDGGEALLSLCESPVDLLVSDVCLPGMDGISLCKALRQHYRKDELPIILTSVLGMEDQVLRGLEAGATDYLVKPFAPGVLKAKIALHLAGNAGMAAERPTSLSLRGVKHGPIPFDRYDLLRRLGRGGSGSVYAAIRRRDGMRVALKILDRRVQQDRGMLARYFREIAVLSSLEAPGVVRFLDSGFAHDRYFLAMELLEGRSAGQRLREDGAFPVEDVARVGARISNAIAALHERGLVHRDIKPGNIMLGPDGSVTLVDFGLAKNRRDNALTRSNELLGTTEFIAPEVIAGAREHVRSDLYSLGVTLWELLLDQHPFPAKTPYDVLKRIATMNPARRVSSIRPDVGEALSNLIARLMEPKPIVRLSCPRQAEALFDALLPN